MPFLTVLCLSGRYYQERGRAHQKLRERARQAVRLQMRWLPGRELVFITDSRFVPPGLIE